MTPAHDATCAHAPHSVSGFDTRRLGAVAGQLYAPSRLRAVRVSLGSAIRRTAFSQGRGRMHLSLRIQDPFGLPSL